MLRLRLDTIYLDLDPGTALTLTVHNPLFDADGAEALYSFPFTLPATPRNLEALAHANRLDNSSNTTTYTNAVLEIEGVPFDGGILELDEQKFTNAGIGAIYKNNVPDLLEQLEKIQINEILETVSSSSSPPVARWTFAVVNTPPVTVNIFIDGEVFSEDFTFGTFPDDYAALASEINAVFPGLASATASNLYLDSVLLETHPLEAYSQIDLISKVSPGESVYTGFRNHVNAIAWAPIDTHCFPAIYWPGFYKETSRQGFWDWVNPWFDSTHLLNEESEEKYWAATYVPFVYSTYVLSRIAAQLPDVLENFSGFPVDDPDGSSLIVFNNRSLDYLEENYYDIDTRLWLNRFTEEIDLNRHVPDMTAAQYIRTLVSGFQLWWKYVGTRIIFAKKRDMLASPPIDWTHLSEPQFTATRRRRRGFILEYPDISQEDQYIPDDTQLLPYTYGDGWHEYPLPFHSATMGSRAFANFGAQIKAPQVNQPGSSDEAGLGDNDYSLRFLFFRGISLASNSDNYLMASSDNTDYFDDPNGDLSLDLQAPDGLYHLHHKGILQLLADGQPVTLALRLSIADILEARKWDNARRTIKLPDGHVTAVIKSIQFRATPDGIGISVVELVQEK